MNNQTPTKDIYMGREVIKRVLVPAQEGDFQTYHKAEEIVRSEGHRTGSMCSPEPTGFAPAEEFEYIAKMRNISPADRQLLHGVIARKGGDFRNGSLEIIYFQTK
jgi:hypothetical protein